jgi:DNA-binding NarL/FixJ family response regulator
VTEDDRAIVRMLAGRMTDNEIAFALGWEPGEVSARIAAIMKDLEAGDRDAAVAAAIDRGLINL